MADSRSNGSSPELVYLPQPSWWPPLLAVGLAAVVGSIFTWWPYGAVGAIVALVAVVGWFRQSAREHDVLPREQRLTVGALPPTPLRRSRG